MNVCSIEWLLTVVGASSLFFFIQPLRGRQVAFSLLAMGFVGSLIPTFAAALSLIVFLFSGYAVARAVQVFRSRPLLVGYIAALVACFLVLKRYDFLLPLLPEALLKNAIVVVGLSYMLFRQIHLIVDAYEGELPRLTPWSYFNYQLNPFGFIAGPIQRFQDFAPHWNNLGPVNKTPEALYTAYLRIFIGAIKVAVIASFCLSCYERASATLLSHSTPGLHLAPIIAFAVVFYAFPLYIYFNFSGYCDMVIGGSSLFGMRMPENFDRPYLARNMIEYWTRWHRTLGFWIRDYVFTPLYKKAAARWPQRSSSLAIGCYFIALLLTGIWHGSTWNFVIFGFLNGLGVAAAKLWEIHLLRAHGRQAFKAYLQSPPIRRLAMIGTMNFVCLTIYFFPSDLTKSFLHIQHAFLS